MNARLCLAAALAAALVAGLPQLTDADEVGDIKAKIAAINAMASKAMIAGDVDTMLKYYTDDVIHMPNYEPMLRGKEAYAKKQREVFAAGLKVHSTKSNILEVWVEGDMVVEVGTYEITLTLPGASTEVSDNGKYVYVWEKQPDGSLKIKVETWCTDQNPWMPPQEAGEHPE